MAITRNERRKLARQRAMAKAKRIADGQAYATLNRNREIVKDNMSRPRERNYYPQSSTASLGDKAPRYRGR